MNKVQLLELLDKYFHGTCTPDELEAIESWYSNYHNDPDYTETLSDEKRELLKTRMFSAIKDQAFAEKPATVRPMYRKWWIGVAAAAALLIVVKFYFLNKSVEPSSQVAGLDLHFTNITKNIVKKVLTDSSVVWLYPNASLSWPKQFQSHSRNVAMAGNCFFEVTKNPSRPFIISSEHIVTKVWGTSFRVVDGKDVTAATVTVVTGKVSVSKKGSEAANNGTRLMNSEVILLPKQQVVLERSATLVASKQIDISDLTLYKHLDMSFDNAKLTEIISVLDKKFDVNITTRDKGLNNAVMTADLTDLNLPEVLEVLKASMKLDYEISQDLIVLKKTN